MGRLFKKALEDGYWPDDLPEFSAVFSVICGTRDADLADSFVRSYAENLHGEGETCVAAKSLKDFVCIVASEVPITLLKKLLSGVFMNGMKYEWLVEMIACVSVAANDPELLVFLVEQFHLKDKVLQNSREEILPSSSLMEAEEDDIDLHVRSSVLAIILHVAWEEASDDEHLKPLGKKATESVVMAFRVLYDLGVDLFSGQGQTAATQTILQCAILQDVPALIHLLQLAAPLHPGIRFKQGEPRFVLSGGVQS